MNIYSLTKISYGMYLVSSKKGERFNGQIANTVFQITAQPPTIAVSINKENLTHEFISETRVFTVSILAQETPFPFIGRFGFKSGREVDKFSGIDYKIGKTKAPIVLENAVAYLEAEVIEEFDVGTHTLFLGQVVDGEILSEAEPMTYAYYHMVKKGKSPKKAPTYIGGKDDQSGS